MKKIYSLLAIAAVISAAGCKKAEVTTTVTPGNETGDDRVPVLFSLGQPKFDVSVKSVGSIEAWNGHSLYILGYDTAVPGYSLDDAFIPNIKATTLSSGDEDYDGTTQQLKVEHEVEYEDPAGTPQTATEPFYYQGSNIYKFFGYYVDDAAVNADFTALDPADSDPVPVIVTGGTADPAITAATLTNDGVYIPFQINGSQDIMIAKAERKTDVGTSGVDSTRCYSAYAARRGIQPNLVFQHQLSRFTFEIKSGSIAGNTVSVESISLTSPSKGYLCVAGGDNTRGIEKAANDNAPVAMNLMETGADGTCQALTPAKPATYTDADTPVPATKIGESIMVIPGEEQYILTVQTSQDGVHTSIPEQTYTLTPEAVTGGTVTEFEAGKSYTVTLTIYGPESVVPTVTLTQWEDGGSVAIDPDEWKEPGTEEEPGTEPEVPDTGDDNPGQEEVPVP